MEEPKPLITPAPLREGDRIAIVSPAGIARRENVAAAVGALERRGWQPCVSPHALGRSGSYSGTADERYADFAEALLDRSVKAIMCTRGGYGAIHLLDRLDRLPLRDNAKWLIGFSDISALHALFARHGIASLHASMTKRLAQTAGDDPQSAMLFDILRGGKPALSFDSHRYNRAGRCRGRLAGGNLSVLSALAATPYDIFRPGDILFIEDINEPLYKIERMLEQLRMRGILGNLGALIAGQFTGSAPDANHSSAEEFIRDAVAAYSYPVAFNVPTGHIDDNIPLIESAEATLDVRLNGSTGLTYL